MHVDVLRLKASYLKTFHIKKTKVESETKGLIKFDIYKSVKKAEYGFTFDC